MVMLRNVNPIGAVDLPLIGKTLDAGEEFDVPADVAEALLEQVGNYERVTKTSKSADATTEKG